MCLVVVGDKFISTEDDVRFGEAFKNHNNQMGSWSAIP